MRFNVLLQLFIGFPGYLDVPLLASLGEIQIKSSLNLAGYPVLGKTLKLLRLNQCSFAYSGSAFILDTCSEPVAFIPDGADQT